MNGARETDAKMLPANDRSSQRGVKITKFSLPKREFVPRMTLMKTTLITRYLGVLSLLLILLVSSTGCWEKSEQKASKDGVDTALKDDIDLAVFVDIQFNGRAEDLKLEITCGAEATVFSATQKALEESEVEFEYRGTGETAFVDSIGGVVNEKAAGDNWVYRVNGELGKVGCGVANLENGDRITWSFGKYELEN